MEDTNVVVSETTDVVTPEPTQEQPKQDEVKTFTQDEVNKLIQSASSKAKFEILNSLGVANVDEFKGLKESNDNLTKESEDLKQKLQSTTNEFELFKKDAFRKQLGIEDAKADDFFKFVQAKVDAQHPFEEVAKEVAKLYFQPPIVTSVETANQTQPKPIYKTYGW